MLLNERCTGWDLFLVAAVIAAALSFPALIQLIPYIVITLCLAALCSALAIWVAKALFGDIGVLIAVVLCIIVTLATLGGLIAMQADGTLVQTRQAPRSPR